MKVPYSIPKRCESFGKKNWTAKSRHFLLLEVLIAMTLIALCAIPLLAPSLWLIQEEKKFLDQIEKERRINQAYGHIVELLYKNRYPWNELTSGKKIALDEQVSFRAVVLKSKAGAEAGQGYFLLSVQIYPDLDEDTLGTPYAYTLFVERKISGELELPQEESELEDEE